jgi:tetratricopeptide (TPR) repeat protein
MSLIGWLRSAFSPLETPTPVEPEGAPADEVLLRSLLATLQPPGGGLIPQPQGAAPPPIAPEALAALRRLCQTGREQTAIELYRRLIAARPADLELKAQLAELLCTRLEHEAARPLLQQLIDAPTFALRARFLLAEGCERAGAEEEARRQLEAILAVDLDYPQARARADRLRPRERTIRRASAPAEPTLAGLPDGGAGFAGRYRLLREIGRGASAGAGS